MASAASVPRKHSPVMTLDSSVFSEFKVVVYFENTVFWWVQEQSLMVSSFSFCCCRDESDDFQAVYMLELKLEAWDMLHIKEKYFSFGMFSFLTVRKENLWKEGANKFHSSAECVFLCGGGCQLFHLSWQPCARGIDTPISSRDLTVLGSPVQVTQPVGGKAGFQTWSQSQGPSCESKHSPSWHRLSLKWNWTNENTCLSSCFSHPSWLGSWGFSTSTVRLGQDFRR